jgi:NAD(P)-dependent dehydrogenase (short-subunit alcohol dehydrogenase family)
MKDQGYGRIVCTTSSVGLFGNFGQANYAAAKMGIVGLVRTLAVEGRRSGILANIVAPAAATAMTAELYGAHVERFRPGQVTPIVVLLASSAYENSGQVYWAGGGRYARVAIVQARGWIGDDAGVTAEDVLAHLDDIDDIDDAFVPVDAMDELKRITDLLGVTLG